MLTRLYIDNFRCFEKFEWKPGRKQLILGRNGTGKTSLMDALHLLAVSARGEPVDRLFKPSQRTRWLDQRKQAFEIEAELRGEKFFYSLVLETSDDPARSVVRSETLKVDNKSIPFFENGNLGVRPGITALSRAKNLELSPFREWLGDISGWHINPIAMGSRAEGADAANFDLTNFPGWYRSLTKASPAANGAFLQDLRASLDGFHQLRIEPRAGEVGILYAEFKRNRECISFQFDELSDGQRCLICLYTIMHFVVAKGGTAIIDEPDNFISLREIQPWLMAIEDIADDHKGQIILISHHPEILNQWANPYGVQFVRDGAGPVRVEKFNGDPEGSLTAAEVVAEGWDFD
jgi:predicted ATPase